MMRSTSRIWMVVFLALAATPLFAASFTSSQSGNWSSSSTWGGAGVPAPGDSVTVNHAVTLDVAATIGSLTLNSNLSGNQPLTISSSFVWNAGTHSGSATTTIQNTAIMTVANPGMTLDGRTLSNAGTINFNGSNYIYLSNNASISNSGTIDFLGDGGLYVSGTQGTINVTNSGTIRKSGGTGTGTFNLPLTAQSGSQFLVQSGTFSVSNDVTSSGATFNVSSGATLYFSTTNTHTFDGTSTISGAGVVYWGAGTNTVTGAYNVTGTTKSIGGTTTISNITSVGDIFAQGGTLTLNGASTINVPTITLQGGTINGTAAINLTGSAMTWTSGSIGGSADLFINTGTTVTESGGSYFDGRHVTNGGIINITGTSALYMMNNATLANSGTIEFLGDGNLTLQSALGSTAITNSGTIKKSGGTTSGTTINIPITASSGGQVLVQAGILYLDAIASTGATFDVSSGATLYLYYNATRTFDAASTISGAGTVHWNGGTNTVSGVYNVTGTTKSVGGTTSITNITNVGDLVVQGGTLTLDKATAINVGTLTMSGGVLNGTASITLTNSPMTWSGGTLGGTGSISIPAGKAVLISGLTLDTRAVINAGAISIASAGYLNFQNNAALTNSGTVDIQGDANLNLSGPVGTIAITNSGTIQKSAGTTGTTISVPYVGQNGSQFLVQSATMYMAGITASGSTFSVSSGATLYLYYNDTRTFDAASTISGAGTVLWGNGTNTVNAVYNITGSTNGGGGTTTINSITSVGDVVMTGGTLTLNKATPLTIPTLTMQGGVLNGTAAINLTAASMTWTAGTLSGSAAISIPLGTTISISNVVFDGRPVTNAGIVNVPGTGYVYLQNNATFTNSGTFDLQGDGNVYLNSAVGSIVFTNSGTFKKSGGTGSGSTMTIPYVGQSGSQFLVQSGIMYVAAVTATSATFNAASGTNLIFYYSDTRTFDAASTISGAGNVVWQGGTNTTTATYNVTGATKSIGGTTSIDNITSVGDILMQGGTLTLTRATALSVANLTMQGGTLAGTAPISVTGSAMTWSGGIIAGSGLLTIPSSTTITMTGGVFLDTRPMTSAGTMNFVGSAYLYLQNSAVLTTSGMIDLQGDGNLYLNTGSASIVNSGTIKKSGGTSGSSITVPYTAQSGGQLLVQTSILYVSAVASTGGLFSVSSGATLYFNTSSVRTFDAASTISGAGTVEWSAGTNTVAATYNITGLTKSSGGTTTISTIVSTGNLTILGGTLTLDSASPLSVVTLSLQGGVLNGTAPINLTGAAMTWTGGTIGGSSALSIPNGTTLTISGGFFIDARQVTNAGNINFTGTSYCYLQNGASFTNSGVIDFQGDGGMYLNTPPASLANSNIIKKSGGSNYSQINIPLTMQSGSQFLVQSATFYLGAVAATNSTFNVSSGATLAFNTGDTRTFDAASTFTGAGTVASQSGTNTISGAIVNPIIMQGGTLALNNASALSIPTLTMLGGVLSGTAAINLTGAAMTWSGGTIGGSGALNIPAATVITINGGLFDDARPITNGGTINFTGSSYMYLQNGAALTNNGTIDLQGDGAMYLNTGAGSIINTSLIKKSGGSNYSQITVPLTAQSGSQLLLQSATMYMSAITGTAATFNVASGTNLIFNTSDTRTFDAASTISGSGTLTFQGGTNTITGSITPSLTVTGGVANINSASTQSIPVLTMQGGTLAGSANLSLTGAAMTWTGGTIGGSGTLTIPAGTTVTVSGYPFIDARTVNNGGVMNLTSGNYMYMQNNAAINNSGTIDLQLDSSIYLNTGAASINNTGLFSKSSGSTISNVTVPFTNAAAGTVKSALGNLSFSGGFTQNGTLSFPIAGATTYGKITVSGALALGGTLTATTVGAYSPSNGTNFVILNYGSASGAFANKNLDYSTGTFTETYNAQDLTLSAGPPTLAVTSVTPSSGVSTGGTSVTIGGSNFVSGANVTFGGTNAASVTFNNSTSLSAVTPAHAVGPVDVVVTNPSTQAATLTNGYTYTGLVSHYSFDVGGTPGKDVAGSNDATSTINVTQTSGKVGNAGSFAAGYMDLPASSSLNLRSGDFTLEAWVKSAASTNGNWFTKAAAGPSHQYGLGTSGGTKAVFSFDGGTGGSVTSTSNIFDGTWHHVAGIKRGSVAEIWVDGRLEASGPTSGTSDTGAFAIGREGSCCESFNGLIDEAKIYNYALTTSEVRTEANAADLSILKSATPSVTVGQNITYSINVTNAGPVAASGVVVTDAIPAGTSYVSANATQGACSGTTNISCTLGNLANGASATVTIVVTATTAGTINNTAVVSGNESDPASANNSSLASTTVNSLTCTTPTITAGGPTTFCSGGSVLLTANASGASAYQWYNNNVLIGGATGSTYSATASGSYSVSVTYPNSCTATSAATSVTVNPSPTPTLTAGGPTSFCTGGSVTLTTPTIAGASYSWSDGVNVIANNSPTLNVTASGNYTVTVTNTNGCSGTSAPVAVTVTPNPTPVITGPSNVCPGGSVTLDAGAGFASYLWSNNATTQTITVTPAATTNYSVTVTNAGGCSGTSATKTVTVSATAPPAISAPASVCANGVASASVGTQAGATYAWSVSNGTIVSGQGTDVITFNAGPSGSVGLSITVTNGACSGSSTASVPISTAPAVTISGPSNSCPGGSVTLDAGAGFTSYHWSNNATTQTITVNPAATTNYSVTVTNNAGCTGTASKTVTVTASAAPPISAPASVCANSSANASITAQAGATYLWSVTNGTITGGQGTNAISFTAGAVGNVTLGVTVTSGGCNASSSASVTIAPPPIVAISGPSSVCPGSNVTLDAGPGFASYLWSTGATTQSITVAQTASSATYTVTVTNGSGCSANASKTVTLGNSAQATINAPASVLAGSAGNNASVTAGPGGTTYAWSISGGTITSGQGTSAIVFTAGNSDVALSVTVTSGSCTSTGSAAVPVTFSADLGITATATPGSVSGGGALDFVLTVTNSGPSDASNVTVTDTLPAGVSLNSATGGGWSCSGGATVVCSTTLVGAGTTTAITIHVTAPTSSATLTNNATISSTTPDPNGSNNTASATATVNAIPCGTTPPALTSPADNAASLTSPVTFVWEPIADATAFELWLSIDDATPQLVTTTNATTFTANIAGNHGSWYVGARFGANCPPVYSGKRSFTLKTATNCDGHGQATPVAPSLNATASSPVTFTWSPVAQAIGYRVWISIDGGAAQDVGTTDGATSLTASVPPGAINWFVDALFAGCQPTHGPSSAFTVPKPDPCANRAAALLTAPANNSTSQSSQITFTWTAAANATGYRLFASINGGEFTDLGTTTSTTLQRTIANGHVVWYVETLFDGCSSLQSEHRAFDVPKAQNCGTDVATLVSPSEGSSTALASVTFSWNAVPLATSYEVWLSLNNASPAFLGSTNSTSLTKDVTAGSLEWFVRANFNGCDPRDSQKGHFTYTPPVACSDAHPVITAPFNATTTYSPVNLAWKEVAGATSYRVLFSIDGAPSTLFTTTPQPHLDDAAVPLGSIDWVVEAVFGNNCPNTSSASSHFNVLEKPQGCVAPTAPVIFAPATTSSGVTYTIRWQKVAGGSSYLIQESQSGDFSDALNNTTDDDNADFTHVNGGSDPITFFYRVRSLSNCNAQPSAYSSVVAIVILPSKSAGPLLTGALPSDQTQNINYSIPLDATLAGSSFSATPNQPWLSITPSNGVVPVGGTNLTVTANTSGLPIGTSLGGITINITGPATNGKRVSPSVTAVNTTVSVSLVQPVQPKTNTAPPPDALIIPAVAHADGINSKFQSDVRVTNTAPQTMKYQVTFTPSGAGGAQDAKQTTIDVDAGKTVALDDILGTWFTSGAFKGLIGTLELRPLTQLANAASASAANLGNIATFASSRTFNVTSNGTYGQYVPAIPFANFVGNASVLSLQQIAQSDAFRTNLGLVEGSGNPAAVLVSVYGGDGKKITDFPVNLAASQHVQLNSFLSDRNITLSDGRVEVKVTSPAGKVTAYASVLDNNTNDPLLVTPVEVSGNGSTKFVLPGVADIDNGFANWRTDTRIYNASSKPVTANLLFYSQLGGDPKTTQITLEPNEVKQLDNTLATTFGVTNDGGALHISTAEPANLITSARTYNKTSTGTFGQFVSGVTPAEAAGAGGRALQILQVEESDRYRSNIGLAEVTGKPATVELLLVPQDGRVSARLTFDLKPNEFRQFNLRSLSTGTNYNARVSVRVVGGEGRVTAYASVIDATTQDPTFIPAQ